MEAFGGIAYASACDPVCRLSFGIAQMCGKVLVQGGGENGKPVRDRALAVGVQRCFPVGKGTAFTWPGRD